MINVLVHAVNFYVFVNLINFTYVRIRAKDDERNFWRKWIHRENGDGICRFATRERISSRSE